MLHLHTCTTLRIQPVFYQALPFDRCVPVVGYIQSKSRPVSRKVKLLQRQRSKTWLPFSWYRIPYIRTCQMQISSSVEATHALIIQSFPFFLDVWTPLCRYIWAVKNLSLKTGFISNYSFKTLQQACSITSWTILKGCQIIFTDISIAIQFAILEGVFTSLFSVSLKNILQEAILRFP